MNKQDCNGVRNAQDLERKYDFTSLLGLKKNIETQIKNLTKVENELNKFINATIGNIENLQEQIDGKITTWYYEGTPTLNNIPANQWNDESKEEHIGDLYYDKLTGYCYRFQYDNSYNWKKIIDQDVVNSLAIANAAKDTADSKRQIFIVQPTTPYDNGDLWISENEIFICQISRENGEFDKNDWINNLKYTDNTVANAIVDELGGKTTTVLKGQVVQITNEFAKYTDLATGGSTTIAGENITTGKIKSQNYVKNISGMEIDLEKGTIDTKNTKLDEYGNLKLNNGAEIITDKGLMTNLQFLAVGYQNGVANGIGWNFVGFSVDYMNEKNCKDFIEILADIPSNFTISKAYITLLHQPVYYTNIPAYGYSRAIALFKSKNDEYVKAEMNSGYYENPSSLVEISNAFENTSGWTPSVPSANSRKIETKQSIDISSQLSSGLNRLIIETKNNAPAYSATDSSNCAKQTGRLKAVLNVYGFIKV